MKKYISSASVLNSQNDSVDREFKRVELVEDVRSADYGINLDDLKKIVSKNDYVPINKPMEDYVAELIKTRPFSFRTRIIVDGFVRAQFLEDNSLDKTAKAAADMLYYGEVKQDDIRMLATYYIWTDRIECASYDATPAVMDKVSDIFFSDMPDYNKSSREEGMICDEDL